MAIQQKTVTVVSQPQLAAKLGLRPDHPTANTQESTTNTASPAFSPEEQKVAQIAYEVMRKLESQPEKLPSVAYLQRPDVQARVFTRHEGQVRTELLRCRGRRERERDKQ